MSATWKRLSTSGKVSLIGALLMVALGVISLARLDLATREQDQVRGRKDVWERMTMFPGGAAAYLIAGRKRRAA